jgi:murein DD-endopeptidase MepM/ murein hydrolase activator NlpD
MSRYKYAFDLDKLLEDVKNLFSGKKSFVQPDSAPISAPAVETPVKSTGYKAPIHGDWHNVGPFDLGMVRFDGRIGHNGLDMSAPAGTPIYALTNGIVERATSISGDSGGNVVGIQHNGLWSRYAHLSTIKVNVGDKVDSNTVIGTVGNTGNAGNPKDPLKTQEGGRTFPHCHFEIHKNGPGGPAVDPAGYFTAPKYDSAFAKNPGQQQKFWLSDAAKQEAQAFNMREHTSKRRVAFTRDVERLVKIAEHFYKLSCD